MKILCLEQGDWIKPTEFPSNGRDWEARRYTDFDIGPNRRARDTDYPINDDNSVMKIANFNGVGGGTILFTGATASLRGGNGFAAFAAAKFGLRAVAQSMARELGPKNIHVAHLIIDAAVDSDAIRARFKAMRGIEAQDIAPGSLVKTETIADAYWFVHQQPKDGWTHELDLRPAVEKW